MKAPSNPNELLRPDKRWEEGLDHDPRSYELYNFMAEMNFRFQGDSLELKCGGDGDNGEELMYLFDCFFEWKDRDGQ